MTLRTPSVVLALALGAALPLAAQQAPKEVLRVGSPQSPILQGVAVPAGRALYITSGIVAPVADTTAAPTSRERYGDTKTQARGILRRIEEQLVAQGLSMRDVIQLRVYLLPDPMNGNKMDFRGWNEAYNEFFGTAANPNKVARATVGINELAGPGLLIEIEAVAVYPAAR